MNTPVQRGEAPVQRGEAPVQRDGAPVQRGEAFEPQGQRGFDQCWYPLALASELTGGQVLGREFLNGKVVLFRTQNGEPHVMSAYCRHLGADLSIGTVVGDELRCPFHYWHYNAAGRCSRIPAGDTPPPRAQLFKFPTAESMGLIWAFNGENPLYEVPRFDIPDTELELRVWRNPNETPVDHSLFFLNAFDLQHFRAVHGMEIAFDPADVTVLSDAQAYARRVTQEDAPIMRTIHFRQDQLTNSDRLLVEGIRWIRGYPRANPAEGLLR